jgi:major vault protein
MSEREIRERDILIAPGEYAYVQDLTKGDIVLFVGPTKISLSNTERLVELEGGRFVPVRGEERTAGVVPFVTASSAQYIVLENPAAAPDAAPVKGANSAVPLLIGRKVVVPGPVTFPLWPGQAARVIDGHALDEDDYLVVRVYDAAPGIEDPIGSEHVVRGCDVSFYVPTTGLEVVPGSGGYVRRAWRHDPRRGLHVRVTRSYEAAEGDALPPGRYHAGQDVFISGGVGYFFPTDHLEVVAEVSAIPLGEREGVYVRDLATGRIDTVVGPRSYLPDPTRVALVGRHLDAETLGLYGLGAHDPHRAVAVDVPPSYAVLVTAPNRREVVRGPTTRILDHDESLEVLHLSTGRPKSDDRLLPTCFLLTDGNKVSDVVRVETADHVALEVHLSYRVSFVEGDGAPEKWFNVKNYVGLLCDHLGSILRAAARGTAVEDLHARGTEVLRSAILGEKQGDAPRPGRRFEENGMWVYDVEILGLDILDAGVEGLLEEAQCRAIASEIGRKQAQLRLGDEELDEEVTRRIYAAKIETLGKEAELESARRETEQRKVETKADLEGLARVRRAIHEAEALALTSEARAAADARQAAVERAALEARVEAFRAQMEALAPELVATLKTLGNQHLAAELSRNVSPLAILGGESVGEVVGRLLGALPIGAAGGDVREVLEPAAPPSEPA